MTTAFQKFDERQTSVEPKGAEALIRKDLPPTLQSDIEHQLMEAITVNDIDYRGLATERAHQVKEYILKTEKVESDRLFLMDLSINSVASKGSRVYLHLK